MGWETVNRLEQIGVQIHGWMSHLPSTRSRGRWMDRQGSRQEGTHPPTKFFQNHTATHQMRTLFSSCQVNYPFPSPPEIDGSMAASLSCSLVVVGTARHGRAALASLSRGHGCMCCNTPAGPASDRSAMNRQSDNL
jgi:hypothetical protein